MPLLKPEILEEIRKSGAAEKEQTADLELLESKGLGYERDLEHLEHLAENSASDSVRLAAVQTSLKLKGKLKDQAAAPPSITIVIQDPEAPAGINPILLPRELHAKLAKTN